MKNACLIIEERFSTEFLSPRERLLHSGFSLAETRLLPWSETDGLKAALIDLKSRFENLFIFCAPTRLPFVRTLLEEVFSREYFQGTQDGMGIYTEGEKSLFLVALSSAGEGYLQGVCIPFLYHKYGLAYGKTTMRFIGAETEKLSETLRRAEELGRGGLAFCRKRKFGEDIVEMTYDGNVPKLLVDEALRLFAETHGDSLYALDDTPLEVQLVNLLKLRGKKIAVAESFTGGGVGRRIVGVPGASEVFIEGLNTYSELSKKRRLGVTEYTLKSYGAVSPETAYEMASGLLSTGDAQVAVATTGLAGPTTDASGLPVGVCCIAVGVEDRVFVSRYKFDGTREEITETAINYALFLTCKTLKNL